MNLMFLTAIWGLGGPTNFIKRLVLVVNSYLDPPPPPPPPVSEILY